MTNSALVAALRVADEAFLVASTIERCPKTMMIRELFMNAVEAAIQAKEGSRLIELNIRAGGEAQKLCIRNTGPGMSSVELHHMCDIAASIGKEKGLDENFGMGAKVASLPSNRFGLRYRSCKDGIVSEVVLCERDGVYGRLRRPNGSGDFDEVIDVTEVCSSEGEDLSEDWTEVLLLGNHPEQDTARDPYDGNPAVPAQWLADYLYHRFYRLPPGLLVKFYSGTHKLGDGVRIFRTIPDRAYPLGQAESVSAEGGVKIHYFFDPPLANTSHNKSVSGAITSDVSTCAIIYKNEIYDLKRSRQWTLDAPIFGIPFGAKHISVHIELPDDCSVRPEAYRQFLRYREGDQRQVVAQDFGMLAREHRPIWLVEIIKSFAPADSSGTKEIRDELQKLLNSLRIKSPSPRLDVIGSITVDPGAGSGARQTHVGEGRPEGDSPRTAPDDFLAVPKGAKRATVSLNAERVPEIIYLRKSEQIEEKGLKEKAAKFYREGAQLFINMEYPAIKEMTQLLEQEYAAAPDPEVMRKMARDLAERTVVVRIGRAVVYALAKQLNREWTGEDVERAQSPESLSLAADDYIDALQNARRRMGQALRLGNQEAEAILEAS
jgi:anti-sigma regulatory factor (Ser/Thr protein kinase)